MGLDAGFLSLLTASVTVEQSTAEDAFGNATFGPARTAKAFIDPVVSTFGATTGTGTEQEGRIVIKSTITMDFESIRPGDRITLPGGTITYAVEVQTDKNEQGADLYQTVTVQDTERG